MKKDELTRRDFLRSSAIIAVGVAAPPWLAQLARADMLKLAAGGKIDPDNILVVCQLSGGNDGLNTVIPWADGNYTRYRPTLAIPEASVLKINDQMGLHPNMAGLLEVFKKNQAAIVQKANYAALDAMAELNKSIDKYTSKSTYANDQFGQGFKQIAQLIATSPRTRVIYFSGGGFDTHSKQADTQAALLKGFSDAVKT